MNLEKHNPKKFCATIVDRETIGRKSTKALKKLAVGLQLSGLKWAICGSLGHALHGVSIIPKDIDIITTKEGAYRMQEIFAAYVTSKVHYRAWKNLRSFFGTLELEGVTVEIMGDIENHLQEGKWEAHIDWDKNIEYLNVNGLPVPVLSLRYEHSIYKKLNNFTRVVLLKDKLMSVKRSLTNKCQT